LEVNIKSISTGQIKTYRKNNKQFQSAYKKDNFYNFINMDTFGLEGDYQADKKHHGGEDKAILIASNNHFDNFKKIYNKNMDKFSFGQNILIDNMTEKNIHVGDIYNINDIQIQVTQPRQPCWKIEAIFDKDTSDYIISNHTTGWYAKIINGGNIDINDKMIITKRVSNISIKQLSQYLITPPKSASIIDKIINNDFIAQSYKNDFQKALRKVI
jgi:MOSC domain-containing protein YiiM